MELLVFIFGLVGIGYLIWAAISPFVVMNIAQRVTELEQQQKQLQRNLVTKRPPEKPSVVAPEPIPIVETPPTAAPPPSVVASAAASKVGVDLEPLPTVPPQISALAQHAERFKAQSQSTEPETASTPSKPLGPPSFSVRIPVPATPSEYRVAQSPKTETPTKQTPAAEPVEPHAAATTPGVLKPFTATSEDEPSTLEEILAGKWLTWVGALAVIIGAGFGFKYAIENNYVGPRERVLIGIITGLACFVGGAYAMSRKYRFLAQGLTGSGLGVLYLSLYASYGMYGLLSYEMAFLGMILTTTLGLSFAGYFNVQPTAVLGMVGGFLTPAMLWPDHDPMWLLFPYLLMLDLGVLVIAGVRRWAGLEILAFCGTMLIWFNWHHHYYDVRNLTATVGYLTATFVLFALLSVWHNVIRRRKANAGDFFLILATPTAYFATLYGLTFEHWPHWQGDFALLMMAFYAGMAGLAAVWHPAGKSIIAALAGLAATFLILAPPLELTGHWVTICWIAQAVLLIELGLYFYERALLWTGLGLLAKVQVILLIYFFGTLADPIHFQTAFVRIQLHLIGRPEIPLDSAQHWWSLINGRSLSYLADVIGFALLAWELGRRKHDEQLRGLWPNTAVWQSWINVAAPLMGLTMIILETYVWGIIWHWDPATIVSAWTIWTAVFACGCILWSQALRAPGMEALGWFLFAALGCFVAFTSQDALRYSMFGDRIPEHRLLAPWLLHPRGISMLSVIVSSLLIAWIYKFIPSRDARTEQHDEVTTSESLARFFGVCAYGLGLGLVLLETRVWSVHHDWWVTSTLTVCIAWIAAFLIGAIGWRVARRDNWIEGLIYPTLMLMKLFLICSGLNSLATLAIPSPVFLINGWPIVGEWWFANPRAIGFSIAIISCLLGVALCRLLPSESLRQLKDEPELARVLAVSAFLSTFAMVWLETYAWGKVWGWELTTIASVWTIWTAPFAFGAIYWSATTGSRNIEQLGWALWIVLAGLIGFNTLDALASTLPMAVVSSHRLEALWMFNPRGISFLTVILAGVGVSWTYRFLSLRTADGNRATPELNSPSLSRWFATQMFYLGLGTVLLESWVWEVHHHWTLTTRLSVSVTWATLFMLAAVQWRLKFSASWVEKLVVTTFGIVCLFLTPETLVTLLNLRGTAGAASPEFDLWLLNPRGFGYLVAVVGCAVAAQCYRLESFDDEPANGTNQGALLGIAAYVLGLGTVLLETTAWGYPHGWLIGTLIAASAIWMSIFLVGLVGLMASSVHHRTTTLDAMVVGLFAILMLSLVLSGGTAVSSLKVAQPLTERPIREVIEVWCWNPRFIAFLVSMLATGACARFYGGSDRQWKIADATPTSPGKSLHLGREFAIATYLVGVAIFTLEVFIQGTSRDWQTATSLAVTLVWTTYATLTLIGGIYWKTGWIRAFSLGLLVITVGKVFLVDVWHLETVIRVFAFISLGVALLLVSFLYRRYRERIRSWIVAQPNPEKA